MAMQEAPRQEIHWDRNVWVNPMTERLREKECLCLNCGKMKPGQADHCPIAAAHYGICCLTGTAFAMTRCPEFTPKAA